MIQRLLVFLFLMIIAGEPAFAQKPFIEGTITYKVRMVSADQREITGIYTFMIKGNQVRKEIKLANGYQDIVLLNCGTNTVYSLQNTNNRKYAIELSMSELIRKQERYRGYVVKSEESNGKKIAGYAVNKGNITYKDGTGGDIYYTRDWHPSQPITFEQFPDAQFIPMDFAYKDENGMTMFFEAEKIELTPVENAVFRIPQDYKMISYNEYKQLSK